MRTSVYNRWDTTLKYVYICDVRMQWEGGVLEINTLDTFFTEMDSHWELKLTPHFPRKQQKGRGEGIKHADNCQCSFGYLGPVRLAGVKWLRKPGQIGRRFPEFRNWTGHSRWSQQRLGGGKYRHYTSPQPPFNMNFWFSTFKTWRYLDCFLDLI